MKYQDRIKLTQNPTAQRLFEVMAEKESNLSLAADLTDANELIRLVDQVGDSICLLKTHIDIVTNFSEDLVVALDDLRKKHKFLIFEDRKFADIGNTVKLQYSQGVYKMVDWADIVNAHVVPGPGIIEGLREVGLPKGRGLLLLAEMSSIGNLATDKYTQTALEWGETYKDFVMGYISRGIKNNSELKKYYNPAMIYMTPGVQLKVGNDNLGQNYLTPDYVINEGSDIIIVGRGIYQASDPASEAKRYRQAGWDAYLKIL